MPIISIGIIKTINESEMQKTKEKQTKTQRSKGNRSYSERVRATWFCCAFKLCFLQLICEYSLTLNRIRISLINYFKTKRIVWVKAYPQRVYMFKNMIIAFLFDMLLNPSFKMTTSFANVARTTASTSKFI